MMTAGDKSALSQVAGGKLSKTQPAKIDLLSSPLWHRWLQPTSAVKQTLPAVFDNAKIASELATINCGDKTSYRAKLLVVLRQHLADAKIKLEQDFYSNNDGAIYVGQHARCIDDLLRLLHDEAGKLIGQSHDVAVIAVGGYGRGEMAPFSDIDVMFLMPTKISKQHETAIEFMLYLLWDLGLKIGHSTRSITEAIAAGRNDQTVMTSFLEMRHVCGNAALWAKLSKTLRSEIGKNKPLIFVEEKLAERDLRHKRFGDTRYLVEPNVKDGKGGLRDLHSLFWIAKYAYRAENIMELLAQGVLRDTEVRRFASAQRFLWTVRCHLHFHAGRAEERLDFDAQMAIAPRMGFSDRVGLRAVERFMKRYYLAIRHVGDLTRIFCAVMETDFRKQLTFWRPDFLRAKNLDPFYIESGRVRLRENLRFRDDPLRIFKLFHIAQTFNADVHPQSLQRVTRGLPSVGAKIRQDPEANALFLDILTASKNSERVLRLMNECGVLGKFLPDFGRIVAMMQFDMYHSYTVDEHTLKAIGVLQAIEAGDLETTAPVATKAMPEIQSRRALFVATLLHDIAKGRGGNHSILGAEVALLVCPRLGLTPEETETVSWLVRHHLMMSKTAFRYDLNDPKTIQDFASIVQSPERLKLLFVLTVADIRAVGPNIWNGWKAALMRELYHSCDAVLRGADPMAVALGNVDEAQCKARSMLASWTDSEFESHVKQLPLVYWTGFDSDSHVRHAELCAKFRQDDMSLLIDFRPDAVKRMTELTILTADDPGLFSRIAGAVAAAGANIAGARITTCHDGTVLDVFFLQDMNNAAIELPKELEKIRVILEKALRGEFRLEKALDTRWEQTPLRVRQLPVPSRVMLSNKISTTHTVIEINGRDFPGLLYKITACLASRGLQIQTASVSTYGERVVDVFYVKDIFGLQIHNEGRLQDIRQRLLQIFDSANEAAA